MNHRLRVVAMIFFVVALLHGLRGLLGVPLEELLPLWMSILISVILAGIIVYYSRTHHDMKTKHHIWIFSFSMLVFAVALIMHVYRVVADPTLFERIPIAFSQVGFLVALLLAYENWHVSTSKSTQENV